MSQNPLPTSAVLQSEIRNPQFHEAGGRRQNPKIINSEARKPGRRSQELEANLDDTSESHRQKPVTRVLSKTLVVSAVFRRRAQQTIHEDRAAIAP